MGISGVRLFKTPLYLCGINQESDWPLFDWGTGVNWVKAEFLPFSLSGRVSGRERHNPGARRFVASISASKPTGLVVLRLGFVPGRTSHSIPNAVPESQYSVVRSGN